MSSHKGDMWVKFFKTTKDNTASLDQLTPISVKTLIFYTL